MIINIKQNSTNVAPLRNQPIPILEKFPEFVHFILAGPFFALFLFIFLIFFPKPARGGHSPHRPLPLYPPLCHDRKADMLENCHCPMSTYLPDFHFLPIGPSCVFVYVRTSTFLFQAKSRKATVKRNERIRSKAVLNELNLEEENDEPSSVSSSEPSPVSSKVGIYFS